MVQVMLLWRVDSRPSFSNNFFDNLCPASAILLLPARCSVRCDMISDKYALRAMQFDNRGRKRD